MTYSQQQIAEMRKVWEIPENFVPVATAPGVIAWVTKDSLSSKCNESI